MDDIKIERMTVVPSVPANAKTVADPGAAVHVLPPETVDILHSQVRGVHDAQRKVCLIDVQIERLKDDKRKAHAKALQLDLALTAAIHEEAAKLGIDVKDPQCPWTFNIDTGIFQKPAAQE